MKRVLVDAVSDITCDRCGRTDEADSMEAQEYLTYASVGGYDSIFGDGCPIGIDLCQHCVKAVMGPWLRVGTSQF